jgi:hypothetical protein
LTLPILDQARADLHRQLADNLWSVRAGVPSNSDKDSKTSVRIGLGLADAVGTLVDRERLRGSAAGSEFERQVRGFLEATFLELGHMRPGTWKVDGGVAIAEFEQYAHLRALEHAAARNPELAAVIGSDYTIKPDIVVTRAPENDLRFDEQTPFLSGSTARFSPLRQKNNEAHLMHASVSCKWTIRSDRSQNSRSEGLNLVRNRKGRAPHVVVVTAEPLPSRLASIAIGTGDIDCTYHIALHELREVLENDPRLEDAQELLEMMVTGKRIRDVSDLPLDLVV